MLVYPTPCEFVINGRPVRAQTIELPLGAYRVHVRALDGSVKGHRVVELSTAGKIVKVRPVPSSPAATDQRPAPTTGSSPSAEQIEAQRIWQLEQAARARQHKRAKTGKVVGSMAMGVGTGLLVVGGAGVIWAVTDQELAAILVGGLFGGAAALGGALSLIVGGAIYGVSAARERRAMAKLGPVMPVLGIGRDGARAGVCVRF